MTSDLMHIKNLSIVKNNKIILNNISFSIKQNQLISIVGKNGSGKTTLCQAITNNISDFSGTIHKQKNLTISYIPQIKSYNQLIPLTIGELICINNKNKNIIKESTDIISQFNLNDMLKRKFSSLSGGEQQKVIILRALLLKPNILVMDEPESFIDFHSKNHIYNIINTARKQFNISIVMVSHDINLVLKDTNWVLCLNNGKIGCQGNSSHIIQQEDFNKIFENNWFYYEHNDKMENQ